MTGRVDDLVLMQSLVRQSIDDADPDKRAPLVNQWRALEATIAELSSRTERAGDPVDDLAARRFARGGATARLGRAEGRSR